MSTRKTTFFYVLLTSVASFAVALVIASRPARPITQSAYAATSTAHSATKNAIDPVRLLADGFARAARSDFAAICASLTAARVPAGARLADRCLRSSRVLRRGSRR